MARFIVKKCHPAAFDAMRLGIKTFEWRREDDVTYALGDTLILLEWKPPADAVDSHGGFTGREIRRIVSYILRGEFDIPHGFAILGLREPPVESATR